MSHRAVAYALATLGIALGCRPAVQSPVPAPTYRVVEVANPKTGLDAPTVVAFHGLGDRPESFRRLFMGVPGPILFPAAPLAYGPGHAWWTTRMASGNDAQLGRDIAKASDDVARWLRARAQHGKLRLPVIVTGFSQGGMLSFALAVRHPDLVQAAVPVGGWIPPGLIEDSDAPRKPPIYAFHGTTDRIVPWAKTSSAAQALRARGYQITLSSFPIGHTVSPKMRAAIHATLDAVRRDSR